jgi:predicted DNA-binding ribbon-helix-helix protein
MSEFLTPYAGAERRRSKPKQQRCGRSSLIISHAVSIDGRCTSVSMEDVFWHALKDIVIERDCRMCDLIAEIDAQRQHSNLSSALKVYVFNYFYPGRKS